MHALTKEIMADYQVRKTRRQKERFRRFLIDALAQKGIAAGEEVSPMIKSVNVVVGDTASARYIFTAHYDTQPELPFPVILAPFGIRGILSQLYLVAFMLLVGGLIMAAVSALLPGLMASRLAGPLFSLLFVYAILFGKANRHTANDNTSGVCVLVEALMTLPESMREQAAFVFFDNEEKGLLGSAFFKRRHGGRIKDTPLINIDCVGNGEVLAFMAHRQLFADAERMASIRHALPAGEGIEARLLEVSRMLYSSDQMHFTKAMGVAAFKKSRWLGLHINRVHTRRDTILDERNVDALRAFVQGLLAG